MFKTRLIAATFAATTALTGAAFANGVPGSDYNHRLAEENARASVATGVVDGAEAAPSVLGYTEIVPGSNFERRMAEQDARAMVASDPAGRAAVPVEAEMGVVPGSDYGVREREQDNRAALAR